ncbi:MAG: hypothetical protein Q8P72_02575 [Candidatus Roizmanbacteria bacterium]|nr:hypothetical protein [Candidatus Roizmanbacteria bacterium]
MRKVISNRKIISLIIVAILASISIFLYLNRYIYKSKAGENTVKVNVSTSEPTVPTAKDFFTVINLSDQKIAALDFSLVYDGTRINYYKETHPDGSGIIQTPSNFNDIAIEDITSAVDLGSGKKRLRIVLLSSVNTDIKVGQIISLKFTSKATGMASFELEKNKFFVAGIDINGNPADFGIEFQNNTASITISNPPTPTPTATNTPTPTTAPCPNFAKGNANCDPQGSISLADFACWRYEYINHKVADGCGGAQKKSADFNSSNSVTLFDFAIWRSSYSRP